MDVYVEEGKGISGMMDKSYDLGSIRLNEDNTVTLESLELSAIDCNIRRDRLLSKVLPTGDEDAEA